MQFFPDISLFHPGIIIELDGKRILVDPGPDNNRRLSFYCLSKYDIPNLDAILITHYHGDHSSLTKLILDTKQFKGPIICHAATAEIMEAYFDDIKKYSEQFIKLDYGKNKDLFGTIGVTIFDAGHVIGSSMISIKSSTKNITITGDLGAKSLPMVRKPDTIFPPIPIDLLIVDAKQIGKKKIINSKHHPTGDVIYHKIKNCFLFDEGNILIYAPLIQIPMLLYCLNYIFESKKFQDIHNKISIIYLDPQPKLLELLEIFKNYSFLFDKEEPEHVHGDINHLSFENLKKFLPTDRDVHKSIIITPNRNVFVRFFEKFKRSEENNVLLLNDNIYYALKENSSRIDKYCNLQIKRLPFLHCHPDVEELTNFCHEIKEAVGVKRFVLYHYRDRISAEKSKIEIQREIGGVNIELVHQLSNNSIII